MSDDFVQIRCPICDEERDSNASTCPHCGNRLICPECGASLDSPFSCWTCGKPLSEEIQHDDHLDRSIGESLAGGFVFHLDGAGGGMVAAPHDISDRELSWAEKLTIFPRTKPFTGTGRDNTRAIVDAATPGSAAHRCSNLQYGGYSDWFLPSRDELNLMYRRLHLRGIGNFASTFYWSSTLHITDVWTQDFATGLTFFSKFADAMAIRAVRYVH